MKPLVMPAARGLVGRFGPPAALRLRSDEVDVWRAALDDQPAEAVQFMQTVISPDEAERARKFYFDRDRRRFVVGRGILRLLLSRYLGRAPETIRFHYGSKGKPALASDVNEVVGGPLYFNVAHSEGLAVYAFTRVGEVGVDVEAMRDLPGWESVAELAFSPRELAPLRAARPGRQREEFFRAWTRQEAVLKALGTGLGAVEGAAEAAFDVHPLDVGPGFAAALAASPAARTPTQVLGWTNCGTATKTNHERPLQTNLL